MANKKIEEYQSCGYKTAEYNEEKGYYKCVCGGVWWDTKDRQPGKKDGYICYNCYNREARPLQSIDRIGNINIRRCKTCGRILLEPTR